MKRSVTFVMLVLCLLIQSSLTSASELAPGECERLYRNRSIDEVIRRDRVSEIGANIYIMGSVTGMVTGQLPITLVSLFTGLPMALWGNFTTGNETKVMELLDEESRRMNKLLKKIHKSISPLVSEDEVRAIIQDGMDSGLYCSKLPKFWGHRAIKAHIMSELKVKYGVSEEESSNTLAMQ